MSQDLDTTTSTGRVLFNFQNAVTCAGQGSYQARVCGGPAEDGTQRWHGWLEFAPLDGGSAIRTDRETTQRNETDTVTWATGLTSVYLEGALQRALILSRRKVAEAQFSAVARAGVEEPALQQSTAQRQYDVRRNVDVEAAYGFARIGGMENLKNQIRKIVETVHLRQEDARRYGVVRNGLLLSGSPGCGKTLFARAIAEEFNLNLIHVPLKRAESASCSAAEAIHRVFSEARTRIPCLLFFDEFDAIASKRHNTPILREQQMVDALLQELDAHREVLGMFIVAATNRFEDLDPAVIREGRFDYKVKIENPDKEGRLAILRSLIEARPHTGDLNFVALADDMDGFSPAQIRSVVDEAALAALDADSPIQFAHLRGAYETHVAANQYSGMKLGWNDLVLPAETKRKLQLLQQTIENPQILRELGVAPPCGLLLFGPPGTGKTTIARVIASETKASFFAINAADVFSKWLGESEQRVKELFERARNHVPAIIFIDEIDAIMERRGDGESAGDRVRNGVVNMFLSEMDGLDSSKRVFVIGATNRPELLDEALLRPGRLGERIEIPAPDLAARREMLEAFSRHMRLAANVDLEPIAAQTEGATGAVLKEICTVAGLHALMRRLDAGEAGDETHVSQDDFEKALTKVATTSQQRRIGFSPPQGRDR